MPKIARNLEGFMWGILTYVALSVCYMRRTGFSSSQHVLSFLYQNEPTSQNTHCQPNSDTAPVGF